MKAVAVIGLEKNNVRDFFQKVKNYSRKYEIELIPFINSDSDEKLYDTLSASLYKPEDFFCALSVGGDGTFLYTSRVFAGTGVPVFGINKGHLGFNTNIEENELRTYLENFIAGRLEYEYKIFLDVYIDGINKDYLVLNEGVISHAGISRTVRMNVDVGGNSICDFRGDGLIVSTPTGSTAYNLSAGGPILHPSLKANVICPICPLTLAIRPYIVPYEEVITIRVSKSSYSAQLTLDGQKIIELSPGQSVQFKKSEKTVKIVKGSRQFSEILEIKLGWMV